MEKCTLCGNSLYSIYIETELRVRGIRRTSDGNTEEIPNSTQISKELLCEGCFEKFIDSISNAMVKE
jgi:hypothetical protein